MTLVIVQLSAKSERFSKLHAELAGAVRAKAGLEARPGARVEGHFLVGLLKL